MHRSTDGSPAYSERRASAWQYWQSIWYLPAWTRWLKKIGWRGPPGTLTIGPAAAGANPGVAGGRREGVPSRVSPAPTPPPPPPHPPRTPPPSPPLPATPPPNP